MLKNLSYLYNEKASKWGYEYRIKFYYENSDSDEMTFDSEKQRDGFMVHVNSMLKPIEIDPNKKPVTL